MDRAPDREDRARDGVDHAQGELFAVLTDARSLVANPENDFSWSSWIDTKHALNELDALLGNVRRREPVDAAVVFAATGPMQELAISSGWGDEFVELADRFDQAIEHYDRTMPGAVSPASVSYEFHCSICAKPCGTITVIDDGDADADTTEVRRQSFTSDMLQSFSGEQRLALRSALERSDVTAIATVEPELAPFHCPRCAANYCREHWVVWDVFDDDDPTWHDSIRGRCPAGHERMLED